MLPSCNDKLKSTEWGRRPCRSGIARDPFTEASVLDAAVPGCSPNPTGPMLHVLPLFPPHFLSVYFGKITKIKATSAAKEQKTEKVKNRKRKSAVDSVYE
ncbi:hypothetical protein GOODEAATRI_017836 [Goodea atripinnis]|uniref:Uncharacterized protein n=1 Tax=Goodea atripinnis TaxID=208336 RepID=A0ABV0MIP9_9TELE